MRRLALIHLACGLGLMLPGIASGQTTPPSTAPQSSTATTQGNQAAPAQPTTEPATGVPHGLFDQTWHQIQFGARLNSVEGDPARFQRYQDQRDGVLFTDARYAKEAPEGDWLFRATADNVGYRDQRYFGDYERTGRFKISGRWDEIPQFYSVDTKTPYTNQGSGVLVLDDAAQRAAQGGAGLNPYPPIAPQFDLMERRDIGKVDFLATPKTNLDLTSSFTTQRHRGELPFGASFGFSNDVEVPLPYDSRTNDFSVGAEWTNTKNMLRVGYSGSWFDNLDPVMTWDSPLRIDDASGSPAHGRMTLWPTNSAQTISFGARADRAAAPDH